MPPHLRKTFIQILPLRQSGDCRFLLLRRVVVLFTPFSFYNFQIFRLQRNEMLCFLMRPLVLPKLLPGTAMMYDRPLFLFSSFVFMTLTSYRSSKGRRKLISLKYANGLRNGANSDTHRCKQLTEHGEERCIKLREVAGFSAVRTIFQIVGPRKILHCLLGK